MLYEKKNLDKLIGNIKYEKENIAKEGGGKQNLILCFTFRVSFKLTYLKLIKLILLTLTVIFLQCDLSGQNEYSKPKYSLLWEISGNGLNETSFLFGTMHVRDKRAFEFPDSLLIALDNCSSMATEIHFDSLYNQVWSKKIQEEVRRQMYDLDEPVANFDPNWLEKNSKVEVKNIPSPPPPPTFDKKKFTSKSKVEVTQSKFNLLDMLFEETEEVELADEFLDAYLFKRARNLGKDLYGLEEVRTQLSLRKKNYGIDSSMVDSLLVGKVPDISIKIDELYNNKTLLLEIYQQGNISKVREFSRIFYGIDTEDRKDWLIDRNKVMLKSMIEIMHKQSLFTAVGCAHLPDEGGLIQLLREAGYNVRKVEAVFTGLAQKTMSRSLEDIWFPFEDPKAGYALELPSKPEKLDVIAGLEGWLSGDMINDVSIVFYGVPCAYSGLDADDPNLYEIVLNRMKDQGRISNVFNKKKVVQDSVEGIQSEFKLSGVSGPSNGKLWLFSKENYLYVFMYLGSESTPQKVSKRLQNSIRFFSREKSENADELKIESKAGFSAIMPGIYDFTEVSFPVDYSEPEFKSRQMQFVSSDLKDNSLRMLIKSELAPGQYFENDSIAFSAIFDDPNNSMGYGEEYGKKINLENGIVGYQPNQLLYEDGMGVAMRAYLRGPCMYLALFQQTKEQFDMKKAIEFFQSITFLPLQKNEMFKFQKDEVTVPVVHDPLPSKIEEYHAIDYQLNDFFSSSSISFYFFKEPDYKYAIKENVDTTYHEYLEQNKWYRNIDSDSIKINSNGDKYLDCTISQDGSCALEREIVFYKNNSYYVFTYIFPKELADEKWFLEMPSEIAIDDLPDEMNPVERRQLFFTDILSTDYEQFTEAKEYIYQMDFQVEDTTYMNQMLGKKYEFYSPEDEKVNHTEWIHNKVVDNLIGFEDDGVKPIIEDYFFSDLCDGNKLVTYQSLKNKKWTDLTLRDLLESNDSISSYPYQYTQVFNLEIKDSLSQFMENLDFYTSHFHQVKAGKSGLLTSLSENLDTLINNGINANEITDILNQWYASSKDSVALALTEERSVWMHENIITNTVNIFNRLQTSVNHDFITATNFIELGLNPYSFMSYKKDHGISISEKEWSYAENYGWGFYNILFDFHRSKSSKLIPKDLRSDKSLQEIAITEIIEDEWGEVEMLKDLGKRKVTIDGEEKTLNFKSFRTSYDDESTYVCFIEDLKSKHLEGKETLWDLEANYSYNTVTGNNYEAVINELLEVYEQ